MQEAPFTVKRSYLTQNLHDFQRWRYSFAKNPSKPDAQKLWERVRRSSFLTVAILHKKNDFVLQPLKEKEEPQEMNTLTGLFIKQPPAAAQLVIQRPDSHIGGYFGEGGVWLG